MAGLRSVCLENSPVDHHGVLLISGFWELHQRHGKLNWSTLFQPAIRLASEGFKVPYTLASVMREDGYEFLFTDPTFKAVFAPNGTLLGEGDTMYRPTYAETLDTIVWTTIIELTGGNVWNRRFLQRFNSEKHNSGYSKCKWNHDSRRSDE